MGIDYSVLKFAKPVKKAKKSPTPIKAGEKTREWESARSIIKKQFEAWGITECEIKRPECWVNNALTFAHVDKRKNLQANELNKVVLACTPCHQYVELELPTKEMRELLEKIIEDRESKL